MQHRLGITAVIAAATISACSSKSSSDGGQGGAPIKTRDMFISASVEAADETTAEVTVDLHNGDPFLGAHYKLTGGDALSACVGTVCRPLSRDLLSSKYEADLPYVAESPYVIALSRQVDVSAPESVVTLPVPFTVLAPSAGTRVTDGDLVTAQWSPAGAGELIDIRRSARCDYEDGVRNTRTVSTIAANAAGSDTFNVDTVLAARPLAPSTQARLLRCDLTIEVVHRRRGTPDAHLGGDGIAFTGGDGIFGRVSRSVTLDYVPSQP